jgi:hypothetical protein
MVVTLEIVFLIVCVVLGLWWFSRTNMYRSRLRSGSEPGQSDEGARQSLGKLPPKGGPTA